MDKKPSLCSILLTTILLESSVTADLSLGALLIPPHVIAHPSPLHVLSATVGQLRLRIQDACSTVNRAANDPCTVYRFRLPST